MTVISHAHYDLLKREILTATGFKSISPADCRVISALVTSKTKHCISETTLKRIYGFALSRFNPSSFTLDVLCKYCNYNSWKEFCEIQIQDDLEPSNNDFDWNQIRKKAASISNLTLQAARNRAGIPYHYVIKRELVNAHLSEFIHSAFTNAILCAPAGYGKTMALCQWVEDRLELNAANLRNDVILFINSNALINALQSRRNLFEWVLALLGCSTNQQLTALVNKRQSNGGKFYLLIDGFDEHVTGSDQFQAILNYLLNGLSICQNYEWLKLVLSLRSSTWINYKHELQVGNNTWFTGFHPDSSKHNNVPLLSHKEVNELCLKINPSLSNTISFEAAETLSHPLFFQYYYKHYRGNFSLSSLNNVCLYELSASFILNNIYLGKNATEKVFIIKSLVENMDIRGGHFDVEKINVLNLLKQHNPAYQELLSIGFLKELSHNNGHSIHTCIIFSNNFLEHSIAKTLLSYTGSKFDDSFAQHFNDTFTRTGNKLTVLKWCLMIAIKTGQQKSLEHLTAINLNSAEKAELMMFIGDLLEKECSSMKENELLLQYFKQVFSEKMFDYFFSLDLINPAYKKTLLTMLRFELSSDQKILVQTALGIIAVIQLNLKEVNIRIGELRKFDQADIEAFAIDPLNCLTAFYSFLHDGAIPDEAFNKLDRLSFSPVLQPDQLKPCVANDMLFIQGAYTMLICGDLYKVVRYVNTVKNIYKTDEIEQAETPFAFFINLLFGEAWHGLGETDKALGIYNLIAGTFGDNGEQLSPIIKARFYSLKIKLLMNTSREDLIIDELRCVNSIAEDSGNKILKMSVLMMLLKHNGVLDKYPFFKRQAVHDLTMIINRNGLNRNRFIVPDMVG
ncbi:hypothetical protein [Mucilaginibacter rubeus]|uniref:NACHT domain-containing protein n=1 Tax=Mucilaginibacter rubeus TaxID=2027860 RepID=A0A5C1HW58_9SPHI|nr:hypothetical protein [Mucilaginibacter rubeus]QEM09340.1 hypothetical protein DEO27_004690 [Mucilaginibacter rubeus]